MLSLQASLLSASKLFRKLSTRESQETVRIQHHQRDGGRQWSPCKWRSQLLISGSRSTNLPSKSFNLKVLSEGFDSWSWWTFSELSVIVCHWVWNSNFGLNFFETNSKNPLVARLQIDFILPIARFRISRWTCLLLVGFESYHSSLIVRLIANITMR